MVYPSSGWRSGLKETVGKIVWEVTTRSINGRILGMMKRGRGANAW